MARRSELSPLWHTAGTYRRRGAFGGQITGVAYSGGLYVHVASGCVGRKARKDEDKCGDERHVWVRSDRLLQWVSEWVSAATLCWAALCVGWARWSVGRAGAQGSMVIFFAHVRAGSFGPEGDGQGKGVVHVTRTRPRCECDARFPSRYRRVT